jgi:hypothetical protein
MKNQARTAGTSPIHRALKADAKNGATFHTKALLIEQGCFTEATVHDWASTGGADADLRRAIALRHQCVFVDDKYAVDRYGADQIKRCAQSYDVVRAIVDACVASHDTRLTSAERDQMTLMAAQCIADMAIEALPTAWFDMRRLADALTELGAEAYVPDATMRAPRGPREIAVGKRIVDAVRKACESVDGKTAAAYDGAPRKGGRKARIDVPYLQLVK